MALIKCSECGQDISDKATSCIHCGSPIEKHKKKVRIAKKNNNKRGLVIFTSITMLVILITISVIMLLGNTTNNNVYDENYTIKAYCVYDLYEFKKKDGGIDIILEGNSDNTKVSGIETTRILQPSTIWSDTKTRYENRIAEIEQFAHSSFDYNIDTQKATNGFDVDIFKLTYEYKTRDNIHTIISDLESKGYECIIFLSDTTREINKNIIGKWVSKKNEKKYVVFNEDGTGTFYQGFDYYPGAPSKQDFYYSYDGDVDIKYSDVKSFLKFGYDKENNMIYKGTYNSAETGKVLLDEKLNEAFYKSN